MDDQKEARMKREVVIIEDSEIIADLMKKFISDKFGCEVRQFASAEAYLEADTFTDVLLLDFYLNSKNKNAMNGAELLKELSLRDLKVPVIIISGISDEQVKNELETHKIVSFINKDTPEFWNRLEVELVKFFNLMASHG